MRKRRMKKAYIAITFLALFIIAGLFAMPSEASQRNLLTSDTSEISQGSESSKGSESSENKHEPSIESRIGGAYAMSGQIENVGYLTKLYDATNGLPTSEANYILGASDGFIWIGGYSGIIKYDGSKFVRLQSDYGLTSSRGLFEDSTGRIWVATNDNGVVVIDKNEYFQFSKQDGLGSSSIRSFAEDKFGNVFIGSTAGVSFVDKSMKLHRINDERINNERILKLMADSAGTIYGQTINGYIFTIDTNGIIEIYSSNELALDKVTTLLTSPNEAGKVYLGTELGTIFYGDFGNDRAHMKKIETAPIDSVHWLCYAAERIWVASTSTVGYLDDSYNLHIIDNLPMNDSIEMMTTDYQGNMWFASSRQGVMKVVANNFLNYSSACGIQTEVVNVSFLHNGELYIGTDNGLQIIGRNHKEITNKITEYFQDTKIRCITDDINGNLWIATFTNDKGLVLVTPDGDIKNFTVEHGMPSNEVRCVYVAKDGRVYAGTNNGIAIINNDTVVKIIGSDDGINNTVILTICEGENGEFYAGSDGDGIYVYDGKKLSRLSEKDGLTSDVILRIKYDSIRNLYWIITSNSIEYLRDGRIRNISTFPYNNNYDILTNNSDNLWIMSSQGIYSVKSDDIINNKITDFKLYTVVNGLTSIPIAHSYSCMDVAGNLYIAGQTGVSLMNVVQYSEVTPVVKTEISSVYYNDNEVFPDEEGTYVIPSGLGRIQIMPAVLDYTLINPVVNVYMEGTDDTGISSKQSELTTLEYTGLGYGDYTLHIQVIDPANGNVISDDTFNISKEPLLIELFSVKVVVIILLFVILGVIAWRINTGRVIRKQYSMIEEAKDEAEQANLAKARFLANMSDEIRTPINTILGMDEMILRENSSNVPESYHDNVSNYAHEIRNSAEILLGQINDLLDMSRIESAIVELEEEDYDIENMLQSIISLIRVRSEAKKLYFEVDIDKTIPKKLYGDVGKIRQILMNLLTNAVKYTEEGGFTLKVSVIKKTELSCKLSFSVKDTGIGFKQKDADAIFHAYNRIDNDDVSPMGTGLGLNISEQFTELMNGTLTCESKFGVGSEFTLIISQKIVDGEEIGIFKEAYEIPDREKFSSQFIAPDADILVVDDNPSNLSVFKGLLKPTKVFVTTASSGKECLKKIKAGNFNVVFIDEMMPDMNGLETISQIRDIHPDLPVYVLTENTTTASNEFYEIKGFNGWLPKPFDSYQIEKTIMKHLPEEIMMKRKD